MTTIREDCGTPRGYQWHRRHGEDACIDCNEAHNARQRAYRRKRPDVAQQDADLKKAKWRAFTKLADKHPDEYHKLLAKSLKELREESL